MRTVVCGIAFKERFSIEGEGVFMRRLFSCCASLALAIGGFRRGVRGEIKKRGEGRGAGVPPNSPPANCQPANRANGITRQQCPPVGGGGAKWGERSAS